MKKRILSMALASLACVTFAEEDTSIAIENEKQPSAELDKQSKPNPSDIKDIKEKVSSGDKQTAAEKAAKELANPNTVYATLNFKFQSLNGFEDDGSTFNTTFQPSMPMPLSNGDLIFFRPAISYAANFDKAGAYGDESGFSDISFDLAYAPKLSTPGRILSYGVFATLPTGSEGFSSEQYALGPEMFVGQLAPNRVVGALATHQWGFGAEDLPGGIENEERNNTGFQFIWVEIAGGGWTYGSTPQMSYDWNENQAEIPLNLMVSKTVIMGGRPWKVGMEANYYVEKADNRPDFMIGFNIAPVVENRLASIFQ